MHNNMYTLLFMWLVKHIQAKLLKNHYSYVNLLKKHTDEYISDNDHHIHDNDHHIHAGND